MKTTVRKIASVTAALAMSLGMLVATAAPASAQARPKIAFDAVTPAIINQPFDVDYSCYKDATNPNEPDTDTGDPWYLNPDMELPPGLTFDTNDNHIKGTPTELGLFKLPLMTCLQGGVNGFYEGIYVGSILVTPPSTPAPSLKAIALNDGNCSVRLIGVLPSEPLPGSTTLTLVTENSSTPLVLRNYAAGELIDITLAMNNFVTSATNNPNVLSVGDNNYEPSCGVEADFVLAYSNQGAPAATASASIFAQAVAAEATVNVFEVVNDSCKVRVIGSVPKLTDDNKIKIVVTANIGGWDLMFDNVRPDQPLDVVIDLKNPDALESMESLSNFMIWGDPFSCENAYIQGGVYYNGIAYGATVNFATRANDICAPGTYGAIVNNNGAADRRCLPAPIGSYVDLANVLAEPTLAPKGYFVNTTNATSATKCPAGLTTELPGARSINDCYKQKFQTAKAIKTPTKLKFGAKHETAGRADAGLALDAVATGSCTVTKITKTVKQNGKNVKQPRWVIKATNKAGNCKVTFSNPGDYTYKPFTVTKTIKVTKTGK